MRKVNDFVAAVVEETIYRDHQHQKHVLWISDSPHSLLLPIIVQQMDPNQNQNQEVKEEEYNSLWSNALDSYSLEQDNNSTYDLDDNGEDNLMVKFPSSFCDDSTIIPSSLSLLHKKRTAVMLTYSATVANPTATAHHRHYWYDPHTKVLHNHNHRTNVVMGNHNYNFQNHLPYCHHGCNNNNSNSNSNNNSNSINKLSSCFTTAVLFTALYYE